MRRALLLAGLIVCAGTAAVAAQNNCIGGLCGPTSTVSWIQPDGTTAFSGWLVKYSRAPNVCTATTGVTTVTITASQLGIAPGTPGPLTVNVPMAMIGPLSNGVYYINVAAVGPVGTSPCDGELSFPFVGSLGATPTNLGVR